MKVQSRVLLINSLCVALLAAAIFLTVQTWQTQVLLFVFTLFLALPSWFLTKKMQDLHQKAEEQETKLTTLKQELKTKQSENEQLNELIEEIDAAVFSLDIKNNSWYVSRRIVDILGFSNQGLELNLEYFEEKIHPEDVQKFINDKNGWLAGTPSSSAYRLNIEDEIKWIQIRTTVTFDSAGKVERLYGMVLDMTVEKVKEEKLGQMAFYDSLTELPNRLLLKGHLRKAISRARRKEHEVTLMFLDLDGFKNVNDKLGHDTGDILLKEVANRLDSSVREEDLISRLGGDEFIIVVEETNKDEVFIIANRILESISEPYHILGETVTVTPSIGISSYPEDGLEIETLIKCADKAMYLAKEKGKANYQFYTKELEDYQPKESILNKVIKLFQK